MLNHFYGSHWFVDWPTLKFKDNTIFNPTFKAKK